MKVAIKIKFDSNPSIHLFLYTKDLRGVGAYQSPSTARPMIHLVLELNHHLFGAGFRR